MNIVLRKILKNWLRFWAAKILNKYKPRIIAITGSTGKTTVKDAVFEVLRCSDKQNRELVAKTQGNLNTEFGVPANIIDPNFVGSARDKYGKVILTLRDIWQMSLRAVKLVLFKQFYPKILILELGLEKPGDIMYFMEFIKPEVGILTNIGDVHLEFFDSKAALVTEKKNLIANIKQTGAAILNTEDQFSGLVSKSTLAKKIMIGFSKNADYRAYNLGVSNSGIHFMVDNQNNSTEVNMPVFGQQFVYSALTALAAANYFGISSQLAAQKLANFKAAPGRFERFDFGDFVLIDDTYNANPDSMAAALDSLARLGGNRRKVAILGDMRELGLVYEAGHQQIGKLAAQTLDLLMVVGDGGKLIAESALKAGLSDEQIIVIDITKVDDVIFSYLRDNDIVLVKGSRVLGMDKIVKLIKQKFNQ